MLTMLEIPELLNVLLQRRRPHGGEGELFALSVVKHYLTQAGALYLQDELGNIECVVGEPCGVVFTSHVDTVHRAEGKLSLFITEPDGSIVADDEHGKPSVLGADDASGIWLLMELIKAGVPGKYLFFVGEEVGGIGSSAYVRQHPNFTADMVVSFDRRGTTDVITHQGGWQTCSDAFASALARQLNAGNPNFEYKPCDTGMYTDSREFAEYVPECTNVAVGYFNEHSVYECQDLGHLLALRDAVVGVDWQALPVARVPAPDVPWYTSYNTSLDDRDIPFSTRREALEALDLLEDGLLDAGTTLPTQSEIQHYINVIRNYVE